ncbi:ribbon-helix-helix protein, CopG family [Microcoleus sp. FACHB-1515]|uniref:ribbon-helix-helix domain-containing protein n=1 Tax=Cyanophyceae TaxID=3028117 RepID=UPI0018F02312|nr:ribbon-helix-helix protein, CopG family [Microcoleus sp. FACHB-1515]
MFDVQMPTDKARVAAYIPHELKEKLEKLAEVEDRTVSKILERLIKQAVAEAEEKGLL